MSFDLPPYKVRISARSRSIGLRVSHEDGLIVTIPRGFDQRLLPSILLEKQSWIERAFQRLEQAPKPAAALPEQIDLRSVNETWKIVYRYENSKATRLKQQAHHVLLITGNTRSRMIVKRLVKSWVKKRADAILPGWFMAVGNRIGIPYAGLTIRDQRTRWGSCSAQNNISLNQKLIFLPAELVEYVMIHELCHTQVHSHAKTFWQRVGYFLPDYQTKRKQLREFEKLIPW